MQDLTFKDCVVIGAGPAGMTAALYLNRFHRNVTVLDAGNSRARWIPESHNCPGFPDGISGDDLLARLRTQAMDYGTTVTNAKADRLECVEGGFRVTDTKGVQYLGRTVLLATGIEDVLPPQSWVEAAIDCGAVASNTGHRAGRECGRGRQA
jgi:thioredoxin reductase (NADPH)